MSIFKRVVVDVFFWPELKGVFKRVLSGGFCGLFFKVCGRTDLFEVVVAGGNRCGTRVRVHKNRECQY